MCAKVAEQGIREALVAAAARLLAEEGPAALSIRRVAAEVGTSTMAVYTHFGGKEDLVRAVVWEGFERLGRGLATVRRTDDPVADLHQLGLAYRAHARAEPHLYAVMFGGSPVPEYRPSAADAAHGFSTFLMLVDAVQRCIDAGRFDEADPSAIAAQLWASAHGLVSLEQHGFFTEADTDAHAARQAVSSAIGFGDSPDQASASWRKATRRRSR